MPSSSGRKILIVIGSLQVGGAEKHVASVMPALKQNGWDVTVYSLAGKGVLGDALERAGVSVVSAPFESRQEWRKRPGFQLLRLMAMAVHLLWVIVRERPRIAHFFLPEAYLIGGVVATLARVPVRVMSRRSLNVYSEHRPRIRAFEMKLHRFMKAVLGNSRSVVQQLHDVEHVPADKLGLIYNGINLPASTPEDRAATRAALALTPQMLTLVIVANLIPYKGHADLLAALALVNADMPADWRFLIVGRDDGIGDRLREQARQGGMEKNIVFLGPRSDVARLLAASDIGVLCSHQEGFSNAVLESMAAGLPMVVTDVGGNGEAVTDGECGFVVPAHAPDQLGKAILRLAKDADLRRNLGAAARKRVEQNFSLPACVSKYQAFYDALLNNVGVNDVREVRSGLESLSEQQPAAC